MSTQKKSSSYKTHKEVIRVRGVLKEITTISDAAGNIVHKIAKPLMVEVHLEDFAQIVVGATLLAVPIAFTEEAWGLAAELERWNAVAIVLLSLMFIGLFTYFYYYHRTLRKHWFHFIKRIIVTYALSFVVVSLLLIVIQKISYSADPVYAAALTMLITFPASMSAAVTDIFNK